MLVPHIRNRFLLLPTLAIATASCSGIIPYPAETPSPPPVVSATPTITWFPATNTPTPFPTMISVPTEGQAPGLGDVLISDDFDDASLWLTGETLHTDIEVLNGQITLAASPKYLALSLRNDLMLTDFYTEITANLNLCRGKDVYGMIVRAAGISDHYRFAVNCNGQVRPERVYNGQMVPLAEWMPSGDAPMGAPGEVRLGIWAFGDEMRFFLNDRYQYTVCDPVFLFGSVGVYILPGGTTDAIVGFSNLIVRDVSNSRPFPSSTPATLPGP